MLNIRRSKWDASVTEKCCLCNSECETFVHAYWKCPCIFHLWVKLIAWCRKTIDNSVDYTLVNCLLLGFQNPLLNVIFTICKFHIHSLRYLRLDFSFEKLMERIIRVRTSDINAFKQLPYLRVAAMYKLWGPTFKTSRN